MKMITVTVRPDGATQVEAQGYTGGDCLAATKAIEEAIGAVETRKMKPGSGAVRREVKVTR